MSVDTPAMNPTSPSSGILRSEFDLSRLPPRIGVEAWQDGLGSMYNIRLQNEANRPVHIRSKAFHFDSFIFGSLEVKVRQTVGRSRALAAKDGLDSFTLHVHNRACGVSRDNGSYEPIRPGDLLILDQTQTSSSWLDGQDDLFLVIPRHILAPLLSEPDAQNARILPGQNPLVSLFRSHLHELYRMSPQLTPEAARSIVRPTLELASAALNGAASDHQAVALQSALTARICRYVEAHVMEPALSAGAIAQAFGISERKLYYLMRVHGGVTRYIQEVRLRRAKAALIAPTLRHLTIAEIAADFGFPNPTSFSRIFRGLFGMSPREARAFAAKGVPMGRASLREARNMWDWMRHLR